MQARKLAEEAFNPKYGVQAQANDMLRSIDTEELAQKQWDAFAADVDGGQELLDLAQDVETSGS